MKKFLSYLLVAAMAVTALAGCGKKEAGTELTAAKDYLYSMYKDKQGTTPSDFERVSVLNVGGVTYNVDWSVDVKDGVSIVKGAEMTTIDVNEETENAVPYVLTATISDAKGANVSVTFNHEVPAYHDTTWAEYAEAKAGTVVNCTGVVTGIMSKTNGNSSNCLYFQDADGAYYAYNLGEDPVELGIETGMTVKVSGTKDIYSGTYEIINAKATIVDTNKTEVAAVDYTDLYTNAEDLKDANLTKAQSLLVSLKGVEITGADVANGYFKFKLADKESYVRISSSVCPIVADKDTFITGHGEHLGWTANVTGILCLYDGAFYLTPVSVDAFEYLSLPERSDEDMCAFEADNLKLSSSYSAETTVELPAEGKGYKDVKIAWTTSDDTFAAIADGVLTIVLPEDENKEVTVTATLTAGAASLTKEFNFVIEAPSDDLCEAAILDKAFALEEGKAMSGKQVLRGTVSEIVTEYSDEYKNITVNLEVAGQTIQCFRLEGEGADKLAVGDEITVTGVIKNYKGTVEFDAKSTFSKDTTVEDAKMAVTLEKAFALEEGKAMNGKSVLKGKVTEIVTEYSDEYKNITVNMEVQGQTVQCFRLQGEGADKLAVGDEIVVWGTLKNYKGTVEFDAKCEFSKEKTVDEAKQTVTLEKAFALEEGKALNYMSQLTGTITEIPTEYSDEYKNVTVNIDCQGQTVQCFRLQGEGADKLAVGDVITVTGTLKNYKGTVEFDAKCTFTK
jgi:DNA/RNA endonuclease YhcR with UshA esterase domain